MLGKRVYVPSSFGAQIAVDCYVPHASREIDPDIRRPAILVCPGGGYAMCSEREAEPIALRFLTEGFNVFVVWYRVNRLPGEEDRAHEAKDWYRAAPGHVFPMPQHDAAAALSYIRKNADALHTDKDRIAIMGFSAGGHLAASLCALWHREDLSAPLGLTPEDIRPNAAILCYPVIAADKDAHRGSFEHLSGSLDLSEHAQYDILSHVSAQFPPAFLWHTFTDDAVPVQNSLRLGLALAEKGVKTELHIFLEGVHGLSLASEITCAPHLPQLIQPACQIWPQLAARFLRDLF